MGNAFGLLLIKILQVAEPYYGSRGALQWASSKERIPLLHSSNG